MINWTLVEEALRIRQTSPEAAEMLIKQAVLPSGGIPVGKDYGVGFYTDENDPRDDSAKRHEPGVACNVLVLENPSTPYKCSFVQYFGPETQQGGGRTLILTQQPDYENVILGTGSSDKRRDYDDWISHMPGQDIVITNKFAPPALGPCSVFLARGNEIISDEVRGMGLPDGLHSVFVVRFERRS